MFDYYNSQSWVNEVPNQKISFHFEPNRKFEISSMANAEPLLSWCQVNLGEPGDTWYFIIHANHLDFFFVNEQDAITFKLVFSEKCLTIW
jgi:hypothetical protein